MKIIRRWYFNNNFEDYEELYNDGAFILVKNLKTNLLSFGINEDFGTFLGFPVNQSCLNNKECIKILERFIEIDLKYENYGTMETWKNMIKIIKEVQK